MTSRKSTSPGPLRAAPDPLDELDPESLSEIARDATRVQNKAAATRLESAFQLVEVIRRQDEAERQSEADLPAFARLDPADRARDHLSAAMCLTTWHAARLVTAGVQIHTRLRLLRKAVARGLYPEQLAIDTACRLALVPDRIIGLVESDVVGKLGRSLDGGNRPSRTALDAMVDEAVTRHDPQAASDAVDAAVEQRNVRFRPGANGMTSMWANLPTGDAEKLRRRIDAAAQTARDAGHPRTRAQLRADALCALGDPTTDEVCDPAGDDPTGSPWATDTPIRISVIDGRPQGLPNQVEFVRGAYASFDWLCEQLLASGDTTFRFELIDPAPGALDSPDSALKYRIRPALAERIRLRDGTCRHPGCTVDAQDCDIDHIVAFNQLHPAFGGPTVEWNLICLCRKHHREKTFGRSAYRPGPLGELIIITDSGHEHRTTPSGPLARARDQILAHRWHEHVVKLFGGDGHVTNPPGADRHGPPPRVQTLHRPPSDRRPPPGRRPPGDSSPHEDVGDDPRTA